MSLNETAIDETKQPPKAVKPRMRLIRLGLKLGLIAIGFVAAITWWLFSVAQQEPNFYRAALTLTTDYVIEGDEFEKRLLDLQNEARTKQEWQGVFLESQINGWLNADFPDRFPDALPPNIAEPRIALAENKLQVAFKYDSQRLKRVIIVQGELDVFCTEVPGQLAVQIKHVKSGLIPIPISSIADRVTSTLRQMGADVEWTEVNGDPLALINIPVEKIRIGNRQIEIAGIQLLEKKLVLTGTSTTIQ